jgi:hypothetical protein
MGALSHSHLTRWLVIGESGSHIDGARLLELGSESLDLGQHHLLLAVVGRVVQLPFL